MNRRPLTTLLLALTCACVAVTANAWGAGSESAAPLQPLKYNHPGLRVDLGVGLWAWPLPMDYDRDGDHDLVVSCPDKPYNGTYFFENTSGQAALPDFQPAVRIGPGHGNIRVSYVEDQPRVLTPGREFLDFRKRQFDARAALSVPANVHTPGNKIRANQWQYVDYDADGSLDLVVGVGDWTDYGWDDAYNAQGEWTRGPLRGLVYLVRNKGSTDSPQYESPRRIQAAGADVEVFGWPSPNFADMDGDGDLDLVCGEFLDRFSYFENVGSQSVPEYAPSRFLTHHGEIIRMDLQMIVPVAIDWDRDGDVDLVVGDEDGRVAWIEHTGRVVDGLPQMLPPVYFQQQADQLKFGALATPYAYDWDGDGDQDILCGNTAGYIGLFENLGGSPSPRWSAVRLLEADGQVIRIQAGANGSIQGPCEAKWGYTTLSVADWNHDELPDIIVNSIWGEVVWYENVGTRTTPKLKPAQNLEVAWTGKPPKPAWNWWDPKGNQLATQWRTTPAVVDFTGDGLNDLVMLDHEGYLALFERRRVAFENKRRVENPSYDGGKEVAGKFELLPGRRVFIDENGQPLRLNPNRAGKSGRRKIHVVDWDGDGRLDVLVNSTNADWLRNVETRDGRHVLRNEGPLSDRKLAGHTSSPCTVDFDGDGVPDLLVGAEDGRLYHMRNPRRP